VIEVQVLGPDDWQLWRELRLEALTESASAFSSTLAQWTGPGDTEERWRARLSTVAMNVVLWLCGAPAGMVSASVRADDAVELISMWVAPPARGRGVGDTAVRAVVNWADRREVVLSVKADNKPAIGLYRRHGFVDAGQSPDDVNERLLPPVCDQRHLQPVHPGWMVATRESAAPAEAATCARYWPPWRCRG
jgi:ribosomal protein S18 acetylase RimI-like enzyme